MPIWSVAERNYDLPRDVALLDTNVLIALFDRTDYRREHTQAVIELAEYSWAVTHANLIEAWNFIVGRKKRVDWAQELMTWVLTPGNVLLVGDAIEPVVTADAYSRHHRVDLVDAALLDIATRITSACDMRPATVIATYDVADFLRVRGAPGLKFSCYDMRTPELY